VGADVWLLEELNCRLGNKAKPLMKASLCHLLPQADIKNTAAKKC